MSTRAESLTPRQLARAIGVSEASVKRWCDQGTIDTVRTAGGHRRLVLESVRDFLERTGRPLVEPGLLGLPSLTGSGLRSLATGRERFVSALTTGSEETALQIVLDLRGAGHSLAAIADDVLLAAEQRLGEAPGAEALRGPAAIEVCLRIIDSVRSRLPAVAETAPHAFVGALDGARSPLPPALAEIVLKEAGWNAAALGSWLPFATLRAALKRHQPGLLVVLADTVRDPLRFAAELSELHREALRSRTRLLAAGPGFSAIVTSPPLLDFGVWRPTFSALSLDAERWRSEPRPVESAC